MSGIFTALALTAVGTGTSMYAQNQNLKNQDQQQAQSIIKQGQINQQAEKAVSNLNQNIAKSNPDAAQKQQMQAYMQALQQAQPTQSAVNSNVPGGSKRFVQAQAASKNDIANYARSTAANTAAVAAPALQRIGEGNQIADVAGQLGRFADTSGQEQQILRTQLAGDQANPWLTSLGTVLQGAGQGMSSYAGWNGGGGKKAPSAAPSAGGGM